MAQILMIVPPERFRDEELLVTREVLEGAGHSTVVASTRAGVCPGSRGGSVTALELPAVADSDALILVGGGGHAAVVRRHPGARARAIGGD